jgi:hypothetical protein
MQRSSLLTFSHFFYSDLFKVTLLKHPTLVNHIVSGEKEHFTLTNTYKISWRMNFSNFHFSFLFSFKPCIMIILCQYLIRSDLETIL